MMRASSRWMLCLGALLALGATAGAQSGPTFQLPEAQGVERVELTLTGQWDLARYDDPDPDTDTFKPVEALPGAAGLQWQPVPVPKSLYQHFGQDDLCHRVLYRTRVDVPASHAGRGFKLHFASTSWILSVFVNGQLAGTHRGVWIPWDMDISEHMVPGQVNEVVIAVKSPWYGFDTGRTGVNAQDQGKGTLKEFWDLKSLRRPHLLPYGGKGDGDGNQYGLINPVTLTSVGGVYTEDVFAKPSVQKQRLENEITVRNTTGAPAELLVRCEAVNDRTNEVEKTFEPMGLVLPAGGVKTITVAGDWADAKYWWPEPNPNLYRLRTTILANGQPVDVHEQLFGFREVTIDGPSFRLNGKRWNMWGWWGVRKFMERPEQYAQQLRAERTRFNRFFSHCALTKFLPAQEDRLEYFDRNGIAGCQSSMIEGMGIRFVLSYVENVNGKWVVKANEPVWENFREHMAQIAKAYRNHPSILMYSLENETVYINAQNFYGHIAWTGISKDQYMRVNEVAMNAVARAAQKYDNTKPYVVSGAGDLGGLLPMNTPHYPMGSPEWYPENAYSLARVSDHVSRWPWKRDKPWYVPESTFANEMNLATTAIGDEAYRGQVDAERGKAVFQRMLFGGYRWTGAAGWSCCGNLSQFPEVQDMLADLVAIPRRQTSRLYGGQANALLFKVMNDTFSEAPVTFEWAYSIDGQRIAGESVSMQIEPGFGQEHTLRITPPATDRRLEGELSLRVSQDGADTYEETRAVPVLPVVESLNVEVPVTVFDRSGTLGPWLQAKGVAFTEVKSLSELPAGDGLVLIGPDSLRENEAYGTDLLQAASRGQRVIVLEQETPAGGENLPVPMSSTAHYGGYAHPQALGTPVFRDLGRWDLIDWAAGAPDKDLPVYKNVYQKPARGASSLAHCGPMLPYSALVEVPCGPGFLVLSQLRIGTTLGLDPAADVLLRNLMEHYAASRPAEGVAAIYSQDPLLSENIQATGLRTVVAENLLAAMDPETVKVAVIQATPENLKALRPLADHVRVFQQAGGWVMLCGLTPDGLDDFNALTRQKLMLRPFRLEQVLFEGTGEARARGRGPPDGARISDEQVIHGRMFPSWNTFSFVADGRDFAPFCRMPEGPADPYEYEPTKNDKDPFNFVNGLFNSLSWKCIQQIWWEGPERPSRPLERTFTLRRPDVVSQINVWNNANYAVIRDFEVIFDGDESTKLSVVLPESGLQEIRLAEPRPVSKTITLRALTKEIREGKNANLVGIENVQFLRPATPAGAVYLDNVGGLVGVPSWKGGWFLNQVQWLAEEPNPANVAKKRTLVSTLLQNMGVGIAGRVGVPGVNVRYQPVDLMNWCNQFRDSRWVKEDVWFGQPGADLNRLPAGAGGEATLASVDYRLVKFTTAPKQDCIMLGDKAPKPLADSVKGIAVGRKADLLFFLHTANVLKPVTDAERSRLVAKGRDQFHLPVVLRYVVRYADGQSVTVPVVLEKGVDHWVQPIPKPLEGAQIAWAQRLAELKGQHATLYGMKFANPRPDVAIETIDVEIGNSPDRAVPAVLAITTGTIVGQQ